MDYCEPHEKLRAAGVAVCVCGENFKATRRTPAEREARLNEKVQDEIFDEVMGGEYGQWLMAHQARQPCPPAATGPVTRNTDLRDPRVTPWIPIPPTEVELQVQRDLAKLAKIERKAQRGSLPYEVGKFCGTFSRDFWHALVGVGRAFERVPAAAVDVFVPLAFVGFLIGAVVFFSNMASETDHQREQIEAATAAVSACEHRLEMMHRLHDDYLVAYDEFADRAEDAKTKTGRERLLERADDVLDDAEALRFPTCERQREALTEAEL